MSSLMRSWLVFILCIGIVNGAYAYVSPGSPSGYVNDFAGILTFEQKNLLENKLVQFNASTTNEISIVTVKNLGGDYVENYAEKLFKEWGIGAKKKDNGILLLIAIEDHSMRIEVGYGLEGVLTDTVSSQIIHNDLTPRFKNNDYYAGIDSAINDLKQVTQGEYVSNSGTQTTKISSFSPEVLILAVIFLGNILLFVVSIFARSKSWWAGGIVGAVIGGAVTFFGFFGITLVIGLGITVVLTLLGLLFDYIISNTYKSSILTGTSVPWWVGGRGFGSGGGFSSSSGSSFGGFGGGRSGGGGASGSW